MLLKFDILFMSNYYWVILVNGDYCLLMAIWNGYVIKPFEAVVNFLTEIIGIYWWLLKALQMSWLYFQVTRDIIIMILAEVLLVITLFQKRLSCVKLSKFNSDIFSFKINLQKLQKYGLNDFIWMGDLYYDMI